MSVQKVYFSWNDFDQSVDQITEAYREKSLTKVVGLSRGGLSLAVALSHSLGIEMQSLVWQTRDGSKQDKTTLLELKKESELNGNSILFVDDICDSGLTIKQIKQIMPNARFAVLIDKLESDRLVEFSSIFVNEGWIVFPWEK